MRGRRLVTLALLTTLAVVAPLVVLAEPASASCGSACDGMDPETLFYDYYAGSYYRCADDAVTVKNGGEVYDPADTSKYVDLRYSLRCRTVWATAVGSGFDFGVTRSSPAATQYCCAATGGGSGGGTPTRWTNMLNDAGYISRAWIHDSNGTWYTIWY